MITRPAHDSGTNEGSSGVWKGREPLTSNKSDPTLATKDNLHFPMKKYQNNKAGLRKSSIFKMIDNEEYNWLLEVINKPQIGFGVSLQS